MPSNLYKMARIIDFEPFQARVRAAMLQQASTMTLGGTATTEKNLGIFVLKNPTSTEMSMVALVAADSTVLAAATLIDGVIPEVESVPDASITSVVGAKWSLVSTKYPVV